MTIHTYSYGSNISHLDLLGKEASSATIGSVPYREGIFACWNDPSKFGLFYHGALIMRWGDVQQAQKTIGARVTDLTRSAQRAVVNRGCTPARPSVDGGQNPREFLHR